MHVHDNPSFDRDNHTVGVQLKESLARRGEGVDVNRIRITTKA